MPAVSSSCFSSDVWYFYSQHTESGTNIYCEPQNWTFNYYIAASSATLILCGIYQLFANHSLPLLRLISFLLIANGTSSLINQSFQTRPYLVLDNFIFYFTLYFVMAFTIDIFIRNISIQKRKKIKNRNTSNSTQKKSKYLPIIISLLIWFSTLVIICFLLSYDLFFCDWNFWIYKCLISMPAIIFLMIYFSTKYYFNHKLMKHNIKKDNAQDIWYIKEDIPIVLGSNVHSSKMTKIMFDLFLHAICMLFIGLFLWILFQSTCTEDSGLEYLPAYAIFQLFYVYSILNIVQYDIFLYYDCQGIKTRFYEYDSDNCCKNIWHMIWFAIFPHIIDGKFCKTKDLNEEEKVDDNGGVEMHFSMPRTISSDNDNLHAVYDIKSGQNAWTTSLKSNADVSNIQIVEEEEERVENAEEAVVVYGKNQTSIT